MSDFDRGLSMILGEPTTEDVAFETALEIIDRIAEQVRLHQDEINAISIPTMENSNYSKTNKYPVFVLLTKGHTILSAIIKKATKDEHSHASIAFDVKLETIYSFGTKKINPREMGFVRTSYDSDIWGEIPTEYDLFVTFIDYHGRAQINKAIQYFTDNADKLRYHWAGLIKIFFKMKDNNRKKFICSRFVAALLAEGGVKMERDSSLYRPSQLQEIENMEFVMNGPDIRKYDYRTAARILKQIKARSGIDDTKEPA